MLSRGAKTQLQTRQSTMRRNTLKLLSIPALGALFSAAALAAPPAPTDFAAEIQPLLRAYCYACHQGDKAAAGLRLDSKDGATAGGVSGKAILPGDSSNSPLVRRLRSADPKIRMPLGGSPLSADRIALIAKWIDEGARWTEERKPTHWSYVPPVRPPVPDVGRSWTRNPI